MAYAIDSFQLTEKNGTLENSNPKEQRRDNPADFEEAITAAGWGKFQFLIHAIAFITGLATVFETTTMSYVFPEAECDLDLQLFQKGLLNAITYAGMISGAMIWGFLFDTLGRRNLLVVGCLLDGFCVVASAASQNFTMLMIFKFFGGFIANGPYAAISAYVSEYHCAKHRAFVQITVGASMGCATLALPLLAMAIMPLDLKWSIGDNFVLHSWNIYLLITSLPTLVSGIVMIFLPESPKFLMTAGRNQDALAVFRKVYRINTGKPEDTYPIKVLIDETAKNNEETVRSTANKSKKEAMLEGWQQMKPVCLPPHLSNLILVCSDMFLILMSLHTLRLWLPQTFQAISDYKASYNTTTNLCTMMATLKNTQNFDNSTLGTEQTCTINHNNFDLYRNSIIVSAVSVMGYPIAGTLINAVGKKKLLVALGTLSGAMAISLYFSASEVATITLSSIFVALGSIAMTVEIAIVVDLFPTSLRAMAISLTFMLGRCGSMIGNIIFPALIEAGCFPPFVFIGSTMILCAILSLFLPNTEMKALE